MDSDNKNNKDLLFVSWDVDTTGRRLLDDICNVGAYCNDFSMQQYIMPYKDIMLPMKRRHNLSTITIGVYRVLRDTNTGKVSPVIFVAMWVYWFNGVGKCRFRSLLISNETVAGDLYPSKIEKLSWCSHRFGESHKINNPLFIPCESQFCFRIKTWHLE